MNAVQLRYVKARAALDAAEEQAALLRPPYPDDDTAEAIEDYVNKCAAAETATNYYSILDAYIAARDALLAWGKARALDLVPDAQTEEIAELYDNATEFPHILEKLIDITLRVNA